MINLKNFEKEINATIKQRGKEYYNNGYVISIEETDNNIWIAEVEGSETYTVEVTLKPDHEISDYTCDCLYSGDICKHMVAVFFTLRDEVKTEKISPGKKLKNEVFDSLLKSLTAKEYQAFIHSYAARNKDFKTAFELFFADKDSRINVKEKYVEIFEKLIQKYGGRGYIDYRSSVGLSKEMGNLLKTGADYLSKNNFRSAFALVKVVLRPLIELMAKSDHSNNVFGDNVENAIELLEGIANADAAANDIKDEIFDFLRLEVQDEDYLDFYFEYYDFGYQLFDIFKDLALQLNKSEIFLEFVDSRIPNLVGQNHTYFSEYLLKEKIEFLQQSGKAADAEKLVQENMDIVEVRADIIDKAIKEKDFKTAKKLIAEGISIAKDNEHPNIVKQWQMVLLRIAILEKDTRVIRKHAKYFAFDHGFSEEYYSQWKETFTAEEWQIEIERHIAETIKKITKEWGSSKNKYWRPEHPPFLDHLAPIYIHEVFLDRLLILVQQANGLTTTLEYHPHLVKEYPNELLAIYLPTLETYGIEANGRDAYIDLVHKMKKIIKEIPEGKEQILAVAKRLKEKFSKKPFRPAMIEELNKIL